MATYIPHSRFMVPRPPAPRTPTSASKKKKHAPSSYRNRRICFESPSHSQTHPPRFISPKPPSAPKESKPKVFTRRKYSKLRPLNRRPSKIRQSDIDQLLYTPLELEIREKKVLVSKEKTLQETTGSLVHQLKSQIEKQQEVIELQNDQLYEQEEEIRVLRATKSGVNLKALSKSF